MQQLGAFTLQVLPRPAHPVGRWPENLVVGYAGGYDFEILKPLIYSFLAHVEEPSWLVLLTPSDSIQGLPGNLSSRCYFLRGRYAVEAQLLPVATKDSQTSRHTVMLQGCGAAARDA